VAAFRVIAYGGAADRLDEYVRLSRSTVAQATKLVLEFIVRRWETTYRRRPNQSELKKMMERNAERGVPGCMGSLDCIHWEWHQCPTGMAGAYQSRKGSRGVVVDAGCDEDLWVWHLFVGAPGRLNDINMLSQSPLYLDVTAGRWPPRGVTFTVNGITRTLPYYLVDSIYRRFAFLVSSHPMPMSYEAKTFNRLQEAIRKDSERLFGVLEKRFHIALYPRRYRSVKCSGSCPHSQRGMTPSESPAQDAERYASVTTRTPGSLGAKRTKTTEATQRQRSFVRTRTMTPKHTLIYPQKQDAGRAQSRPPGAIMGGLVPNGPRSQARASSGPCSASLTALPLEGGPRPSRAEAGKSLRLPRFQDLPKTNTLGLIPRFFNFPG